jgi:ribonuclease T2
MPHDARRQVSGIRLAAAGFALLLAGLLNGAHASKPGQFDYLVLALSWSPTYCAEPEASGDDQQCGPGKRFAFVVHGLWPQHERGWPENCAGSEAWVSESVIGAMLDVMPSKPLIIHEWRKHGSCSGLSVANYFRATRLLFEKVRIPARYLAPTAPVVTTPAQLVADFVKSNRDLAASMLSVQCGNARDTGRLAELRICIDRHGNFRQCGANEVRQCQARRLVLPPVR